ncbi:uncharacterized protein LOC120663058 isoform X3 [Panicum virgatum]|uniref:uncharacterized protein LOC120663058 isoform X3 n=1 Tax=Panicum virgatum TaxID=38727 RepID=UPI0019D58E69|nr:uncharacterized protein LOC120663058 isoform X3 [Panicum virgatum]
MDLVTGAMGNLAPKLYQLLQGEYELQKGVRKKLEFLDQELESIKPALDQVAQVPWDQHHTQVKVWARQMREASYDIEDLLDTFLVRVQGSEAIDQSKLKRALKKMGGLFGKAKARRDISSAIEDIKKQLREVADRRDRCKINEIVAKPADTSAIDPRLEAMYKEVTQLIGIDKSRGELLSMLSSPQGNEVSHEKMKTVSVVGVGGLGKTTLAKAVYDELKSQFDCGAFVPVGRNPDVKKVLRDILIDLDKKEFREPKYDILDVRQLINELKDFLQSKRVMKQLTQQEDDTGMARVRSLVACRCDIGSWVLHPSFKLLRVLALERCNCEKGWQGLKHLGDLLHLRYLGLQGASGIYELPEEIGKLKFLQILDLVNSGIQVLPFGVCQLTQLVCLRGDSHTLAPDGLLKKVTSLEELRISIDNLNDESKRQFVKALGNLSELRVLRIYGFSEGTVQSDLHKLQQISQSYEAPLAEWDRVVLSQHLHSLILPSVVLRRLPSCINPARLPSLCYLDLFVEDIDEAGLRAVGGLPQLRRLNLHRPRPSMASSTETVVIAGDGFFQKLRHCIFSGWMVQFVVNEDSACVSFSLWNGKQQGALAAFGSSTEDESSSRSVPPTVMPNLQELAFRVPVRALYKDGNDSCRSLGLHCLPSLRRVTVYVDCEGASPDDVEKAEAELRHAAQLHPNSLMLDLDRWNEDQMMRHSTDQIGDQSKDGDDLCEEEEEEEGEVSSAGDEVIATELGADPTSA